MKKLLCLFLAALLLCGCQRTSPAPTDSSFDSTILNTTMSTGPTPPSTNNTTPSIAPTEPHPQENTAMQGEQLHAYLEAWEAYSNQPFTFIVIPGYHSGDTYDYAGKDFDKAGLKEGYYYAVDDGAVYYLTDQHLAVIDVTAEHIYYVMSSDPTALYRCTLHGEDHTLLYRSNFGNINQIQYSGIDSEGQLFIVEAGACYRVIMYDLASETKEVLLERIPKGGIYYRPHSLDYTSENKGAVLEIIYYDDNGHHTDIYSIEEKRYIPN